jgi:uncharacterized membrane protein
MDERRTLARAVSVGLLGVVFSRRPSLLPRSHDDQTLISAGAALMGAITGAFTDELAMRLGRSRGRATTSVLLGGAGLAGWLWASGQQERNRLTDAVETVSAVAAAGAGVGEVGAAVYLRLPCSIRFLPLLAGARMAVRAAVGLRALRRRLAEPADRTKASISYSYLPTVSGAEGSLVPRERLDREGRKFLGLATPAVAIEELMGPSARDPIRVYVGVGSAPTREQRVRLALDELERLGGFERGRILVAIPTGSGFVNPVFLEAEENMSRGDVATVALQYNDERSIRSLKTVPAAADSYRSLLEALRTRLDARGDDRPQVAVYGESLGAWVGAEIVAAGGLGVLETLRVDRAVLLGIPALGAHRLLELGRTAERVPEAFGIFRTAEDMAALSERERQRLRYAIVSHPEDPVANYSGLRLLWRRPLWLARGRVDPRVPAGMRWHPGITFLHVAFDVKNGTSFTPVFAVRAHDYRAEHPAIVRIAFGHGDVSDERLSLIAARTMASARAQKERELVASSAA